ncbi:50S ribosomal protein L25 [Stieleria bergensis]|uniref:Large ribosomal subunit protein bL25 n=1 Tax=Stieleria bergensis TaxID=2528025 RepID=A0A517SSD0_9BACT|nr:50S ribosomal protein L25 [Planctomycetes bacterium SV_7m_r]
MAEVVQVERREGTMGTSASRRLRKTGQVPAVLYGHKQGNEHLTLTQKSVDSIIRHHSKIVELQGAVNETALVSDLQFDPLGIDVLHIDLQRVDLNERVTVTVSIQFKGEPAGAKQGGIVIESGHEVEVECPAVAIPEAIVLQVTAVAAGENRTAGDLVLPENVSLVTSPETVVYHIEKPKGMRGKTAGEEEAAE